MFSLVKQYFLKLSLNMARQLWAQTVETAPALWRHQNAESVKIVRVSNSKWYLYSRLPKSGLLVDYGYFQDPSSYHAYSYTINKHQELLSNNILYLRELNLDRRFHRGQSN
jgi:hypothetical protein